MIKILPHFYKRNVINWMIQFIELLLDVPKNWIGINTI